MLSAPEGGEAKPRGVGYHDALADGWTDRYAQGGFRRRGAFVEDRVLPASQTHGSWIDVGCGSGYFSRKLASGGADVLGIDGSAAMIRAAQAASNQASSPRYTVRTVESLAVTSARYDGVLCLSVLEYLDAPETAFGVLARMLKPAGRLIVSVPNRHGLVRAVQRLMRRPLARIGITSAAYLHSSRHAWSRRSLRALAVRHGLTCEAVLGFDPVLFKVQQGVLPPSLLFMTCRAPAIEAAAS